MTAVDKRRTSIPYFRERFDEAAAAPKAAVKSKPAVLDLTRPSRPVKSGKSPAKRSGKSSSGKSPRVKSSDASGKPKSLRKFSPRKVQRRPSQHHPGADSVRRANEKTSAPKETVHTMLPGSVVWKEVRPDLRQALLAGIKYEKAMDWLSSDKAAHGWFREPQLLKMLVSMMYWQRLDVTPWSRFVPEIYYVMADERLDRLLKIGRAPPVWEPLDSHVPYPDEDAESTVDDPSKDPDFPVPSSDGSLSESEDSDDDSSANSGSDGHERWVQAFSK
ncbi:hypothetical protein V7S43_015867 [Phytophthora oleae]|uniref:Uncharacterized protein n=1 Tax=Phytophthora oleae TaxID=2107226 RepID=A0ABD3F1E1_9STRA